MGLVGLVHPVTKEFNHKAVIEMRGGRHPREKIGYIKDFHIHTLLGSLHNLLEASSAPNWATIANQ